MSEIREIFESIKDAVKNLLRLSIIVRNSTRRDRYSRAASAAMASPFDEHYDIDHVRHKFPDLAESNREWLIQRLGSSITQRRHYLRYCREHHAKISKNATVDNRSSLAPGKPIPPTVIVPVPTSKSENSKPTSTLAPTQASTLALTLGQSLEEEDIEDTQSQTSYATSIEEEGSDGSKLSVVALDDILKHEKYFECPYCWQIQAINNQRSWKSVHHYPRARMTADKIHRKHVFSDLKPYVCTHEGCDLKMFSDRRTWFSHELDHRQKWCCYFCRGKQVFTESIKYQIHMEHAHPEAFTATQLPTLLELSRQQITKMSPSDCPLCSDWERHLRAINPHIPSSDKIVVTLDQFQHHVGGHMQQLALFAIPRGHNVDGDADTGNAAHPFGSEGPVTNISILESHTATELRLCEDILEEICSMSGAEQYRNAPDMPSVSLRLRNWPIPKTSPIGLAIVFERLEQGAYKNVEEFALDVVLVFAYNRAKVSFEASLPPLETVETRFMEFCETSISSKTFDFLSILSEASKKIRWKWWMPTTIPPEPVPSCPNEIRVTFVLDDGTAASRRFLDTTTFEQLYAFVECYDTVLNFPKYTGVQQPFDYTHQYDFRLRLRPAGTICDVNHGGKIGDVLASNAELTVEILHGSGPLRETAASISPRTASIDISDSEMGTDLANVVLGSSPNDHAEHQSKLPEYQASERPVDDPTSQNRMASVWPSTWSGIPISRIERKLPTQAPIKQAFRPPESSFEDECLEKVKTYASFRIETVLITNEDSLWATSKVSEDFLDTIDIRHSILMPNARKNTTDDEWEALDKNLKLQIMTLLDSLNSEETDSRFEWTLLQMELVEKIIEKIPKCLEMRVFLENAPKPKFDVVEIFRDLKAERTASSESVDSPNIALAEVPSKVYRILDEKLIGGSPLYLVLKDGSSRHTAQWQSFDDTPLATTTLQEWEDDKRDICEARLIIALQEFGASSFAVQKDANGRKGPELQPDSTSDHDVNSDVTPHASEETTNEHDTSRKKEKALSEMENQRMSERLVHFEEPATTQVILEARQLEQQDAKLDQSRELSDVLPLQWAPGEASEVQGETNGESAFVLNPNEEEIIKQNNERRRQLIREDLSMGNKPDRWRRLSKARRHKAYRSQIVKGAKP